MSLTDDRFKSLVGDSIDAPRIALELDEADKTLTIADTGIGMNEEDLVSHLVPSRAPARRTSWRN